MNHSRNRRIIPSTHLSKTWRVKDACLAKDYFLKGIFCSSFTHDGSLIKAPQCTVRYISADGGAAIKGRTPHHDGIVS